MARNSIFLAAAGIALIVSGGGSNNDALLAVAAFSTPSSPVSTRNNNNHGSIRLSPLSVVVRDDDDDDDDDTTETTTTTTQSQLLPLQQQLLQQVPQSQKRKTTTTTTTTGLFVPPSLASLGLAAAVIAATTATTTTAVAVFPEPAYAYIPSDYASETVQNVIQELKAASGNVDETFRVYENIAGIITEGKGVGGQINYQGIQLERGYVADEDTTIYNPGLSLLTESEKERLVEGVIDARKAGLKASNNQWSENNQYAFEFLRQKLDPFHTTELRGYLGIVPYYGAALYLAVLAVQQFFRDGFQVAYLVGVVAFFAPILGLILAGP
eukprot:jgi/Psemu1/264339/estExt_Genewise1Plus.C_15920001